MGPQIKPVSPHISRPIWSVMIPTFNCAKFLATALSSVLAQDPGPDIMQIEVVDDASTRDDPEAVVREFGQGRIRFHRQPHNVGATRNFTACVERSHGHLVHILHADDWVLPGFYERIELLARRHPEMAFFSTRAFLVDESGGIESVNARTPTLEKPSKDITPFVYSNPFSPPAIVVRRQFYEALGGFIPELVHTADWEMWVRAVGYAGGCVLNQPLACYRTFKGSDSNRLARTAENLRDFLRLGEIFRSRYGGFNHQAFLQMVTDVARAQACRFRDLCDLEAATANETLLQELARLK
jgi:glycosyltransferase involved in cell wall biosynthesis